MLISSLVIFPALTAMRVFRSFRGVVLCAGITSVVCFFTGLMISFSSSSGGRDGGCGEPDIVSGVLPAGGFPPEAAVIPERAVS